jgi:hypothetical protein
MQVHRKKKYPLLTLAAGAAGSTEMILHGYDRAENADD